MERYKDTGDSLVFPNELGSQEPKLKAIVFEHRQCTWVQDIGCGGKCQFTEAK